MFVKHPGKNDYWKDKQTSRPEWFQKTDKVILYSPQFNCLQNYNNKKCREC